LTVKITSPITRITIICGSPNLTLVYEKFFQIAGLDVVGRFQNSTELFYSLDNPDLDKSIILYDESALESNGCESVKKLKQIDPNAKILLAAANKKTKFAYGSLFDGIVFKPFTISELLHEIEKVPFKVPS